MYIFSSQKSPLLILPFPKFGCQDFFPSPARVGQQQEAQRFGGFIKSPLPPLPPPTSSPSPHISPLPKTDCCLCRTLPRFSSFSRAVPPVKVQLSRNQKSLSQDRRMDLSWSLNTARLCPSCVLVFIRNAINVPCGEAVIETVQKSFLLNDKTNKFQDWVGKWGQEHKLLQDVWRALLYTKSNSNAPNSGAQLCSGWPG